jgi:signal transduction histidine kinase/ligand-binding sensor domain-containing protein
MENPKRRQRNVVVPPVLRAVLLLALFLLSAKLIYALDPDKRFTQYSHTSWRIQDGSLPSGMFSITQTSDGFLWFLSLSGDIYRFDGVQFLPWHWPGDRQTQTVGKLFADHAGGLWVVADELIHLKNGVVTAHFKLPGIHGFQSISEEPDGSLWVGRRGSDAPLCRVTDSGSKCFGKEDGIALPGVDRLLADGRGGFWLGGPTALVHWREGGAAETYPIKGPIGGLALDRDGSLWVGMAEAESGLGLAQLREGVLKPFVTATFDGSKLSVTSLMFDRDGNLWVATDTQGLFRIHGNAVEHYGRTDGLSGDSAWALFEDREGIVWAGTTSGIDSFHDPSVVTFSMLEGLGKDTAAGIIATRDDTIWVANNGSLDRISNGTVTSIRSGNGLPGEQVASLLEDRAGNMWVGVDDGLYLYKDGKFRRLPEPDHQPLGMVVGIAEDTEGNVWAECASKPRKLVRIRDFQVREVFPESAVPAGHNLTADPQGGIWIETRAGEIALFRNGAVQTKFSVERVGSPLNRQIFVEADGSVLVGSENGLVGWRAGKVQRLTTKNGLPCDFVIAFIKDREKRWWLYTRCGLVEFPDTELQKWWANPDTTIQNRVYDAFDGAQPNIGSFNAAACTSDGRVWFSSGVVVQMVDPSRVSHTAVPAEAYVQSVVVDRKEFGAGNDLKFGPNPRELAINYTSPTFLISQRVKFRYRLDGYDREWHDADTRRQAFYTDLPPGNYSFLVTASNSDGVWNDKVSRWQFSIAPAYYQTNWFRLLCAAAFLAVLWVAYQLRIRRLATQFNMTLDARVSERTRIARELHDTLLQSFQGLLLRFQSASNLLPARPVEAKQRLDNALDHAAAAITEGRDAVQGLRSSVTETNELRGGIIAIGKELVTSSPNVEAPTIKVEIEGGSRQLNPLVRDEVLRIAAEALRNAFRHSGARCITVDLRYETRQFRLSIRDDGKGVDEETIKRGQAGHFGLHGMRERAEVVGGRLDLWSKPNAGTQVELSIPAGIAYDGFAGRSWLSQILPGRGSFKRTGST